MKKTLLACLCGLALISWSNSSSAYLMDFEEYQSMFDEPITKSANGTPQRLSDVTLNMDIITEKEIELSGARTITELLRFVPGVSVKQYAFGQSEVSIRGYNQANSERILVLLDGRQVYLDTFGQVAWENIPVEMSDIQQIEVIKGPNTALFGFNAVSGVINIVTKDPRYSELNTVKTNIGIGVGSFFETSVASIQKTEDKKYAVKFTGKFNELNEDFSSFGQTSFRTNPNDVKVESMALDFDLGLTDNLEVDFTFSKNDFDRNEYMVTLNKADNYYRTDAAKCSVVYEGNSNIINFDTYFNQSNQQLFRGQLFDTHNKVWVTSLSNTFEYNKNNIFRTGMEFRDASNIYEPYDNAYLDYQIYSANGLWSWSANENLNTSLALRYDYFKLSPDGNNVNAAFLGYPIAEANYTAADFYQERKEVSINAGAVYKFNDKELVRASYARGIDLPSFTEFGMQMPDDTDDVRYIGNPYTNTSIVTNYEVDYERNIDDINGKFKGAIFYQENKDMQGINTKMVNDITVFSIVGNIGDSRAAGFELGFEGKYKDNWTWEANYSFVNIDDDFTNKTAGGVYYSPIEYENSNEEHRANFVVNYIEKNWNANVGLQFVGPHEDLVFVDVDTYGVAKADSEFILNAHYSYKITDNIIWSISGQNILGDTQQYAAIDTEPFYWTSMEVKF